MGDAWKVVDSKGKILDDGFDSTADAEMWARDNGHKVVGDSTVDIMLTDDDLGYYSILHKGEFLEKDFQSKKEAENWARENNYTYAEGGIMADGRLVLGSSYGVGGNKNKTYKLIKDDRDSDGKPYYEVVEHPSNSVMAQGDDFVEVNNMYKIFTGKQ